MTWINSADDFINPRNFDYPQIAVRRMKDARFHLIPETTETRGHGTHTWAKFWKDGSYFASGAVGGATSYAETWFIVISQRPRIFLKSRVLTPSVTLLPRIEPILADQHRRVGREQIDLHIVEMELAAPLR